MGRAEAWNLRVGGQGRRPPGPHGEGGGNLAVSRVTCPGHAASRPSWRGRRQLGSFKTCPGHAASRPSWRGRRQLGIFKTCPGHAASRPSWRGKETTWQFTDMPRSRSLQTLAARQGNDFAVSRHAQVTRPPDPRGEEEGNLAVSRHAQVTQPPDPRGEARKRLGSLQTCPGQAASRPSRRGKETTSQFQDMPRSRGLQTLVARQGDDLAVSRHAQVRQLTAPCAGGGR